MFYNAKNLTLKIGDTEMDYVSFGKGSRNLVMIPGGGDGLTTVKGLAVPMAFSYRMFADDYKVYVFSRKNRLKEGYSTRDMADDQAEAMRRLGISNAMVLGVSQGGMISQYIAIDHPELVEKLVLAVTLSKQNDTVSQALGKWIELAEQGDHKQLMINTAENSYSEKYLKKYRMIYPILGLVGKPKNYERFIIQINSCLQHDAYGEIEKIKCPVLVIGGRQDKIVTGKESEEIAEKLGCEIYMYDDLGHAAYEEAKDFNERILAFFKEK